MRVLHVLILSFLSTCESFMSLFSPSCQHASPSCPYSLLPVNMRVLDVILSFLSACESFMSLFSPSCQHPTSYCFFSVDSDERAPRGLFVFQAIKILSLLQVCALYPSNHIAVCIDHIGLYWQHNSPGPTPSLLCQFQDEKFLPPSSPLNSFIP
jgi:uncharacterized protein YceK